MTTTKNRCAAMMCNKVIKASATYCPACIEKAESAEYTRQRFVAANLDATPNAIDEKRDIVRDVYVDGYRIGKVTAGYWEDARWNAFTEQGDSPRDADGQPVKAADNQDRRTYGWATEAEAIAVLVESAKIRQARAVARGSVALG